MRIACTRPDSGLCREELPHSYETDEGEWSGRIELPLSAEVERVSTGIAHIAEGAPDGS